MNPTSSLEDVLVQFAEESQRASKDGSHAFLKIDSDNRISVEVHGRAWKLFHQISTFITSAFGYKNSYDLSRIINALAETLFNSRQLSEQELNSFQAGCILLQNKIRQYNQVRHQENDLEGLVNNFKKVYNPQEEDEQFPLAGQKGLGAPINQPKIETSQVDIQSLSSEKYRSFILKNESRLHPNKRQLLDNTVLHSTVKPSATPLTYQVVSLDKQNFQKLLNSKVQGERTQISCLRTWYDYKDPHSYWVDFANATSFGGGYKSRGNVQEETMFCEFPDLAYLDCAVKGNIHPCTDGEHFCPTDATPFIIKDVTRQYKVDKALYGRKLEEFNGNISEKVERLQNQPPVSIIGLAAVNWNSKKIPIEGRKKYQLNHLEYHLKAAYLGNIGAKEGSEGRVCIHTSSWGCGAFANSYKMMVAIQILAAKMADVDVVFHGTTNGSVQMVAEIQTLIQQNLDQGKTAADILQLFLKQQEVDSQWAPQ
jgi:hypothetical protein